MQGVVATNVKLACFKLDGPNFPDDVGAQVSNVINLFQVIDAQIPFTMNIDTSVFTPVNGDMIVLIVWEDDGDDQFDVINEEWDWLETTGFCQVFGADATFAYFDMAPLVGWYYMDPVPALVEVNTNLTGADLKTPNGL